MTSTVDPGLERWAYWRVRLQNPAIFRATDLPDVGIEDLVLATQRTWPGSFMRRDMYRIGPVGWTALAVAAFGNGQQTESRNRAPDWALVPALAALGAGPSLLKAAIKTIKDPHLATGWERLVSAAGSDGRVLVARVPEDTPDDAPIDPSDRRHGVLLALRQEPIHYRGLLDWIASTGVELVRLEGDEGGS